MGSPQLKAGYGLMFKKRRRRKKSQLDPIQSRLTKRKKTKRLERIGQAVYTKNVTKSSQYKLLVAPSLMN